jgi:hypothetical protein
MYMADYMSAAWESRHIELNLGNVFAIGLLSILFNGAAAWTSNWLARTDIPVLAPMGVGMQVYLHGA